MAWCPWGDLHSPACASGYKIVGMETAILISTFSSPLLTLAAVLIAVRQLNHARQYDDARQIAVAFTEVGIATFENGQEKMNKVAVEIEYKGFTQLRGLTVTIVNGLTYWRIDGRKALAPGEKLGPKYLDIPNTFLQGSHLHVSWHSPHPSPRRGGLRYQALRLKYSGELQEWRWHSFEGLRRRLKLPVGRWKTVKNRGYVAECYPGWPHGKANLITSWE